MVDTLRHDLGYAIRSFRRSPLFAAGVAITIGFGLGFAGTAFAVINAYVFRTFDFKDPHALYEVGWASRSGGQATSIDDLDALRQGARVFEDVLAFGGVQVAQEDETLYGQMVTGNFFSMLGIRPALGRLLADADAPAPGTKAVVVLSYDAWRARFGADPAVVGRDVRLGSTPFTVIGVAQPGFVGFANDPIGFWVPITMARQLPVRDPYGADRPRMLTAVARLRGGVTPSEASAWYDVFIKQRFAGESQDGRPIETQLRSRATRIPLNGRTLALFSTIEAAFAMVLLIACANVANLMLARGVTRQREIAVRVSLGASRARIIQQLFIESMLLAVPAAAVGYALTLIGARLVHLSLLWTWPDGLPPIAPLLAPVEPDVRVIGFLIAGALIASALFGLLPALQTSKTNLAWASRGEFGQSLRGAALRNILVVAQIAACAVFLVMAIGVAGEVRRASTVDTGLAIDPVADLRVPAEQRAAMLDRLSAAPGIEAVAAAWRPPLAGMLTPLLVTATGQRDAVRVGMLGVSPEYFQVFRLPLVSGRVFTRDEADAADEVAIISAATAHRFWPGQDAIGQTLEISDRNRARSGPNRVEQRRVRVIGIAPDVISGALADGVDASCVYLPASLEAPGPIALLVRGRTTMAALRKDVGEASEAIDPGRSFPIYPMRTVLGIQVWALELFSTAASALALIAMLLAVSGTYAVLAYLVSQRTREFGVRIAIGATPAAIVRGMMAQAARIGGAGMAIGAVLAAALSQFLASTVQILPSAGAGAYALGAVVMLTATIAAASVPAFRASRVDPSEALRTD